MSPHPHLNLAIVRGCLSSDPVQRELPSGDVIWSYELTARQPERPTDTVPVVLVGVRAPQGLAAGGEVVAIGRVRRRFFRSEGSPRVAPRWWPTRCCRVGDERRSRPRSPVRWLVPGGPPWPAEAPGARPGLLGAVYASELTAYIGGAAPRAQHPP